MSVDADSIEVVALASAAHKTLTVVMPAFNERHHIDKALRAILANGFPLESMHILVVDGGSTDGTREVLTTFARTHPELFEIMVAKGATVYRALQIALDRTATPYLVRVDARSVIPPGYLQKCLANLERPGIVATGGVQQQVGSSAFGKAVAAVTSNRFGVGNAEFRLGRKSGYVDTVYLGAYRTRDLKAVGGFDVRGRFVSEDAAINARLRATGRHIYLDADLRVLYPAKETPAALARQYFIYGAAKATHLLSYGRLTSWRQVLPVVFLLAVLGSAALATVSLLARFMFFGLLVVYASANLIVSVQLRRANGQLGLMQLAKAFVIIHFAWPCGFFIRLFGGEMLLAKVLTK
jgi:succinoglycan biosynthesis protein ExoA